MVVAGFLRRGWLLRRVVPPPRGLVVGGRCCLPRGLASARVEWWCRGLPCRWLVVAGPHLTAACVRLVTACGGGGGWLFDLFWRLGGFGGTPLRCWRCLGGGWRCCGCGGPGRWFLLRFLQCACGLWSERRLCLRVWGGRCVWLCAGRLQLCWFLRKSLSFDGELLRLLNVLRRHWVWVLVCVLQFHWVWVLQFHWVWLCCCHADWHGPLQ